MLEIIDRIGRSSTAVKSQNETTRSTQVTTNTELDVYLLMLPYKGEVGETTLKSLRNTLKSVIPANNTFKIISTGTKLASKFNIKDKISEEHNHDLIYKAQCPDLNETDVMRHILER